MLGTDQETHEPPATVPVVSKTGLLVFVGPGLSSFEQLAATARRTGVDTAWIGYPYSWIRRMRTRAFVPHVASADDVAGLTDRLRSLDPDRITDILASEYVLADVIAAARGAGVSASLLAELERRLRLTDKLVMARLLNESGIGTPTAVDASEQSAAQAAESLGLPLVVKGRVGNGGTAVHIVHSVAEAEAAAREVGLHGGALYEAFLEGDTVSYSASFMPDGRILHDAVYITERIGRRQTGPPHRIQTVDGKKELAVGRTVVGAIGGAGLVNVNLITDSSGNCWVHDVNLRPWGTMLALRQAGVDFAKDYLQIIGLAEPQDDASTLTVGQGYDVFPSAALAIAESDTTTALKTFAGQLPDYRSWTGVGYIVAELARSLAVMIRDRLRRRG